MRLVRVAPAEKRRELAALRRALEDAVLRGEGTLEARIRRRAADDCGLPKDLQTLVHEVHHHPHRVTNDDLSSAVALHGEDGVFEIVVSAAVGAARHRLDRLLALLEES
jgi:hypothetical protein